MSGVGMSEHDEYHLLKHMWLDYFRRLENKNQELEKEIEELKTYIRRIDYQHAAVCMVCYEQWNTYLDSDLITKGLLLPFKHDCGSEFNVCANCREQTNICYLCGTSYTFEH